MIHGDVQYSYTITYGSSESLINSNINFHPVRQLL